MDRHEFENSNKNDGEPKERKPSKVDQPLAKYGKKTNCIFKLFRGDEVSDKYVENRQDDAVHENVLYLDGHDSSSRKVDKILQRHKAIMFEALVKLRMSSKKNVNRLNSSNYDVPKKDKKRLAAGFVHVSDVVNKYMEEIVCMNDHVTYSSLLIELYQLEAKFNAYRQDFIDVVTNSKNKQGMTADDCKKIWTCFSCWRCVLDWVIIHLQR